MDDGVYHDEIEIEDFQYDDENDCFTYPCPCGDLFTITRDELLSGDDVARCPTCSLIVRVIYDKDEIVNYVKDKLKLINKEIAVK